MTHIFLVTLLLALSPISQTQPLSDQSSLWIGEFSSDYQVVGTVTDIYVDFLLDFELHTEFGMVVSFPPANLEFVTDLGSSPVPMVEKATVGAEVCADKKCTSAALESVEVDGDGFQHVTLQFFGAEVQFFNVSLTLKNVRLPSLQTSPKFAKNITILVQDSATGSERVLSASIRSVFAQDFGWSTMKGISTHHYLNFTLEIPMDLPKEVYFKFTPWPDFNISEPYLDFEPIEGCGSDPEVVHDLSTNEIYIYQLVDNDIQAGSIIVFEFSGLYHSNREQRNLFYYQLKYSDWTILEGSAAYDDNPIFLKEEDVALYCSPCHEDDTKNYSLLINSSCPETVLFKLRNLFFPPATVCLLTMFNATLQHVIASDVIELWLPKGYTISNILTPKAFNLDPYQRLNYTVSRREDSVAITDLKGLQSQLVQNETYGALYLQFGYVKNPNWLDRILFEPLKEAELWVKAVNGSVLYNGTIPAY